MILKYNMAMKTQCNIEIRRALEIQPDFEMLC